MSRIETYQLAANNVAKAIRTKCLGLVGEQPGVYKTCRDYENFGEAADSKSETISLIKRLFLVPETADSGQPQLYLPSAYLVRGLINRLLFGKAYLFLKMILNNIDSASEFTVEHKPLDGSEVKFGVGRQPVSLSPAHAFECSMYDSASSSLKKINILVQPLSIESNKYQIGINNIIQFNEADNGLKEVSPTVIEATPGAKAAILAMLHKACPDLSF